MDVEPAPRRCGVQSQVTGFGLSPWAWWGAEPPGPTPLPLPGCSILAPLSTQSRRPQARELPRFCSFSPPRRCLPPTARQKPSMFKTYSKSDHFPSALQLPRWSQAPLLLAGREQWLLRWPPSPSSRGSAVTLSAVQQTGEHLCSSTSRLQWPPWLRPQLAESHGTGPANRPSPSSSSQRAPCPLGPTSGPLHAPSPLPRPLIPQLSALSFWSVQMPRPL